MIRGLSILRQQPAQIVGRKTDMIKLILTLILCLYASCVGANPGGFLATSTGGVAAAALQTDSATFSAMGDANPAGGDWTTIPGDNAMRIASSYLRCASGDYCGVYNNAFSSLSEKQYSAVKVSTSTLNSYAGPAVRIQSGANPQYYMATIRTTTIIRIVKRDNTTYTQLDDCTVPTLTNSSLIGIKATGSTLQVTVDGSDVSGCSATDATYSGGNIGIANAAFEGLYTYWEGGEW